MKKALTIAVLILSFNSFAASVVDSMYETSVYQISSTRDPASNETSYCVVNDEQKVFAKSCYSSKELCQKRLDFWKDLPGAKNQACAKI